MYALRTLHAISTKYASTPHSGVALRTILAAAELLRAKACIVISPDSESITPEWISNLIRPVYYDGFDLVSPAYRRHKFDGLLMTNLLYPMIRALYGAKIREAYMPEFGFSGRLGSQFLGQNRWDDGIGEDGTELRLTLAAVTGGFRICQSFLGKKDPVERRAADLIPALRQFRWCVVLRFRARLQRVEHGFWFSGGAHNRNRPGNSSGSLAGKSETPAGYVR